MSLGLKQNQAIQTKTVTVPVMKLISLLSIPMNSSLPKSNINSESIQHTQEKQTVKWKDRRTRDESRASNINHACEG